MPATIPLTVTQEAADFIAEKKLHEPFQKMLDSIPQRLVGVHAIAVTLQPPYDLGGGPCVIFNVTRDNPRLEFDPTEMNWQHWVAGAFPPEEFTNFCLLSIYV